MKRFFAQCLLYLGMMLTPAMAQNPVKTDAPDTSQKVTAMPVKAAVQQKDPLKVDQKAFQAWLKQFKQQQLDADIVSDKIIKAALPDDMTADISVLKLHYHQPDGKKDIDAYLKRVVNDDRVNAGISKLKKHSALLDTVCGVYDATPAMLVSLWGVETDYGAVTGDFNIMRSLATLAFAGKEKKRADFTDELRYALRLIQDNNLPMAPKGSWAGAIGQPQSMPKSFYTYAVDFDGDGKKDIWKNLSDIFGFAANHMKQVDWHNGETWGYRVRVPNDIDTSLVDRDNRQPLEYWEKLGVRLPGGAMIPREGASATAALIQPDGKGPGMPAFLVFDNFRALRKWNKSDYFAVSAGMMYDRIKAGTAAPKP